MIKRNGGKDFPKSSSIKPESDLSIEINYLYSWELKTHSYSDSIQFPSDIFPNRFLIKKYKEVYQIQNNGLISIEKKTKIETIIAKRSNGNLVYPVKLE